MLNEPRIERLENAEARNKVKGRKESWFDSHPSQLFCQRSLTPLQLPCFFLTPSLPLSFTHSLAFSHTHVHAHTKSQAERSQFPPTLWQSRQGFKQASHSHKHTEMNTLSQHIHRPKSTQSRTSLSNPIKMFIHLTTNSHRPLTNTPSPMHSYTLFFLNNAPPPTPNNHPPPKNMGILSHTCTILLRP